MSAEENLARMKTLDDAWNAQNWEVFRKRHSADTKVYWPGQPDPTRGRDAHQSESEAFFKSIENHLDNNPYRVMFGSGDWTCTIARWTGKMIGPWKGLDGKVHDATGKTFELEFCTVARWQNGEIVEENLVLRSSRVPPTDWRALSLTLANARAQIVFRPARRWLSAATEEL